MTKHDTVREKNKRFKIDQLKNKNKKEITNFIIFNSYKK